MSSFLNQQLTDVGWDALSVALGGGTLTFYKMQAGSGNIANDEAIPPMTALVAPVTDIAITSYVIEGDGQITLFGNISSEQIDVGFNFTELGVFAVIEDPVVGQGGTPAGPNITAIQGGGTPGTLAPVVPPPAYGTPLMYSYANSYATSDYIPGAAESTDVVNTIQVTIKIDKAPNVQISILQGEQFAVTNIGGPEVGAGPWSYTQANVAYMKRLVAGALTDIHEDTNTITIGQKQLTADLDLYVANGNPDISPNFSSIQNALNYLGQYVIPTSIKARINVSAGTYTSATSVIVDHPNSQSITIQGPENTRYVGTSLSIIGSSYNWDMTINGIGNTSQFLVDSYAIVDYVLGVTTPSFPLVTGCFRVLSKTASSVTLRVPNPKSSFSIAGATNIGVVPINVLLTCSTLNTSVFYIGSAGLRLLQNVAIVPTTLPTSSTTILNIQGTTSLRNVGVTMWNVIINSEGTNVIIGVGANAPVTCTTVASTYNTVGFFGAPNANFSMRGCVATYNSFRGAWVEGGFCGFSLQASFVGGNNTGLIVSGNGSMAIQAAGLNQPAGYVFLQKNDNWGLWCTGGGSFGFSNAACTLNAQDNTIVQSTHYDVVVQNYGLVNNNVCIIGSRVFNSPVGVINSTGGLIN
jgi:hypothetical protein